MILYCCIKKHVNWDSYIASSPILQSSFFKEVCCLILTSSQKKLRGYIKFLKFDVTIKNMCKSFEAYFLNMCIGTE